VIAKRFLWDKAITKFYIKQQHLRRSKKIAVFINKAGEIGRKLNTPTK
jgi:hypothetical protein